MEYTNTMIMLCRITDHDTKSVSFHTTVYSDEVKAKDIPYSKMHLKYSKPEKDRLKCLVHSYYVLQHWKSNGLFGE